MPYFVFRINSHRDYLCLENFTSYRDARDAVRAHRRMNDAPGVVDFRMIFATSQDEGEALLRARRERTPSEDD
jgi:hypothetical protein